MNLEYQKLLTPTTHENPDYQMALDWWKELPLQDIRDDDGKANYCIKFLPDCNDCQTVTVEEVFQIYNNLEINLK